MDRASRDFAEALHASDEPAADRTQREARAEAGRIMASVRTSLFAIALVGVLASSAPALAQLHYCERRTETCWACADVEAGFAIPCEERSCADGELCVTRDGAPECHASTPVCCEDTTCEMPPGCDGAASACTTPSEPGDPHTCTFLSPCPPLPSVDGGVSLDAGVARDAGASMPDANVSSDASVALDAGARDGASAPMDARGPLEVSFAGGGGCRCTVARAPRLPSWLALAVIGVVRLARRRH